MAKGTAGRSTTKNKAKRAPAGPARNGPGRRVRRGMPRNLREIYGVLLLVASLLLFLGFFFSSLGPVGRGLEWLFSYLLGYVRFVLPFLLLLAGIALILGRWGGLEEEKDTWRLTWVELTGIAVLTLAVCALLHLGKGPPEVMFDKEMLFEGGGLLGALICWPLVKLISRAGAYVMVIGMLFVGFLLFTGLTVSQYMQGRVERRRKERERRRSLVHGRTKEQAEKECEAKEPEKPSQRRPGISAPEADALVMQARPPLVPPERANAPALVVEESGQVAIEVSEEHEGRPYRLPPLELLVRSLEHRTMSRKSVNESIAVLEKTLRDFGVDAAVTHVTRGPTVTRFEVELGSGVKVNRVLNLSDDIAYAMASPDIRIITPIPGKSALGIEIPNRERDLVSLGDILATPQARKVNSPLRVGLGMDISGHPVIVDLREMPHLLLAGATNTGKSCCINAMITSVLMTSPPQEVRMLLIDPKYVELSHFNGLPHLLAPVVTDPKKASGALSWLVREMEQRYQILSRAGVKNLVAYKDALKEGLQKEVDEKGERQFPPMPYILVCIDELAELMLVSLAEVEDSIARIAQMARAVGIHLVVATQRPSVDVVTGIIKANMPSRIAFKVASQADSRVILDMGGAEKLVGHGDMLFLHPGSSRPIRLQGAFISEREIAAVVAYIKRQRGADYSEDIVEEVGADKKEQLREDELLEEAMEIVVRSGMASASLLQRKLRIGYARAARLVDLLEDHGVVGGYEGSKPRAVLMTPEELEERRRRMAGA